METNNNYNWRPNDNSSTTNLKYQLEADHWLKAVKSSDYAKGSGSMLGDIGNMFLVLSLLINIIKVIVMVLWEIIKWIIRLFWTPKPPESDYPTEPQWTPPQRTAEEIVAIWNSPRVYRGDISNHPKWNEK